MRQWQPRLEDASEHLAQAREAGLRGQEMCMSAMEWMALVARVAVVWVPVDEPWNSWVQIEAVPCRILFEGSGNSLHPFRLIQLPLCWPKKTDWAECSEECCCPEVEGGYFSWLWFLSSKPTLQRKAKGSLVGCPIHFVTQQPTTLEILY